MRNLTQFLADWLAQGGRQAGQIHVAARADGTFLLCHCADLGDPALQHFSGAESARLLANADAAGNFRPLKTAPNLARGWQLEIADLPELRRALEYFYPAMLGVWRSQAEGALRSLPLREVLERQAGMYRITQKITDPQAQALVAEVCPLATGCLKHILWRIDAHTPITSLSPEKLTLSFPPDQLPLLCHEACNLLVAKAREVVKKSAAAS